MPSLGTEWGWVAVLLLVAGYFARTLWEGSQRKTRDTRDKTEDNAQKITKHGERISQLEQMDRDIQSRLDDLENSVSEMKVKTISREDLDRFEKRIQTNIQNMKSSLDQRFDALINGLNIEHSDPDESP